MLGTASMKEGYMASIAASGHQLASYPQSIKDAVFSMMVGDWIISGVFGVAILLLIYGYLRDDHTDAVQDCNIRHPGDRPLAG